MTWPTAANKTHLDAATDDPKQARGELATLVDKFNEMRTHVSSFMQTFLSRTTASAARSDLGAASLGANTFTASQTIDASSGSANLKLINANDAEADINVNSFDNNFYFEATSTGRIRFRGLDSNTNLTALETRKGGSFVEVYDRSHKASQAEAEAGTDNDKVMTALRTKQAIDNAQVGATAVLKTADESVTSSTTLQNDDHLVFAMEANKTYSFRLMLIFVSASASADLKSGWTVPTGATMFWGAIGASGEWDHGSNAAILVTESDTVIGSTGGGNTQGMIAEGIVRNGANAGNFQLQWAQNSSSASAVTVKEGSNLVVRELGAT